MNGREWFLVATRAFGLWVLYNGLSHASMVVEHALPLDRPAREDYPPGTYLLHAFWHLTLAAILLFRTEAIGRVVCGAPQPTSGLKDAETGAGPDRQVM